MPTIRELFHKIGNGHNKITVAAGLTKEILKQKTKEKDFKELKDTLIKKLSELERFTIETDSILNQLKDIIYGIIDPDTGKLKNKKGE